MVEIAAARALLKALETHSRTCLIVIGGVGSLEVEPGLVYADSDEHLHTSLDQLGLPSNFQMLTDGPFHKWSTRSCAPDFQVSRHSAVPCSKFPRASAASSQN
ncbi:hypothetical protein ABZY93_25550 [Streptomyces smyrnaeus]|uniref:hypothetical protein n=1 Tax=Streptomyces smyrnaeus TaxID=1387713 RepID=UPI0033A52E0E